MKNKKKIALAAATFGIAALAMGGSTFAWFQVANTANVALEGTVVAVDDNLDIGFKTPVPVAGAAGLGLIEDDDLTNDIDEFVYWAPQSVNAAIMDAVIAASGHTSGNELKPITSGSYEADDAILPFYARPEFDANRTNLHVPLNTPATKADYIGFTVMFRALTQELDPEDAVGVETPIYFDTPTTVTASAGVDALRLGFKAINEGTTNIIKPEAAVDGETTVGGVMDLNGDGANDYTFPEYILGVLQPQREIVYGEFDGLETDPLEAEYDWAATATNPGVTPEPFSNQDFLAGDTATGIYAFEGAAKAKTAEYTTFATYFDDPLEDDILDDIPLTSTDANGLAEVEMMMWLEGWDPAAKNNIQEALIGAALAFVAPDLY
ncbi:MAG TPA: hypothetical protein PK340_04050 [Bacilli bacterium]|nr:hypothetical protein [Bacilli bacterium]